MNITSVYLAFYSLIAPLKYLIGLISGSTLRYLMTTTKNFSPIERPELEGQSFSLYLQMPHISYFSRAKIKIFVAMG